MKILNLSLIFILSIGSSVKTRAVEVETAQQMKSELQFDLERRKAFSKQNQNNKIFDRERDKDLAIFLEELEKWDMLRERGRTEFKKTKKENSAYVDDSPEAQQDEKLKKKAAQDMELARKLHVETKNEIKKEFSSEKSQTEEVELGLAQVRPRYDLRKRYQTKWGKAGDRKTVGSSSGSGGVPPPPPIDYNDFPPPVDYNQPPPMMDNFEEIPPPPPPMDTGQGYDSGFGDVPMPPPPPPPPDGWDF